MPRQLMTTDTTLEAASCAGIGVMAAGIWWFVLEYASDLQDRKSRQEARRGTQ